MNVKRRDANSELADADNRTEAQLRERLAFATVECPSGCSVPDGACSSCQGTGRVYALPGVRRECPSGCSAPGGACSLCQGRGEVAVDDLSAYQLAALRAGWDFSVEHYEGEFSLVLNADCDHPIDPEVAHCLRPECNAQAQGADFGPVFYRALEQALVARGARMEL